MAIVAGRKRPAYAVTKDSTEPQPPPALSTRSVSLKLPSPRWFPEPPLALRRAGSQPRLSFSSLSPSPV